MPKTKFCSVKKDFLVIYNFSLGVNFTVIYKLNLGLGYLKV